MQRLIAGSVPNLDVSDVVILDESGRVIGAPAHVEALPGTGSPEGTGAHGDRAILSGDRALGGRARLSAARHHRRRQRADERRRYRRAARLEPGRAQLPAQCHAFDFRGAGSSFAGRSALAHLRHHPLERDDHRRDPVRGHAAAARAKSDAGYQNAAAPRLADIRHFQPRMPDAARSGLRPGSSSSSSPRRRPSSPMRSARARRAG